VWCFLDENHFFQITIIRDLGIYFNSHNQLSSAAPNEGVPVNYENNMIIGDFNCHKPQMGYDDINDNDGYYIVFFFVFF